MESRDGFLASLGVLVIRVAIAFVVIAFTVSELAFADEIDYWSKTTVSEKNLKDYISQNRCYNDENSFLGCINAINSILSSVKPTKILTNKRIESIPGANETVKVVEGLKIQNFKLKKNKKQSFVDSWKESVAIRAKINQSWKQLYTLTKSKQISIEQVMNAALTNLNSDSPATYANAINMYLQAVYDPHTYIIPKAELNARMTSSEDSYAGIGAQVQLIDSSIVLTPMEGSPAQKAGLRYLDVLTHINGKSITDVPFQDVTNNMIRGPENTPIHLTVQRDSKSVDINIVRGKIVTKNISGKMISDAKTNTQVGYIKLNNFTESGLCKKFVDLAMDLRAHGAQSLVLDLRGNGGGLVNEALCMASNYVDGNKEMLITQNPYTNEVTQVIYNDAQGSGLYNLYQNKPLVIVLDAGSASASELITGTLQAYGRAVVVGEKSFGKGTMQAPLALKAVGLDLMSGVQLMGTVARFHFASGESNQLVGITPDFLVDTKPNATEKDKFALREADLYPNAIHSAAPPHGMDTTLKTQISQCVRERNNIASEYAAQLKKVTGPDYQLLTAREVAACL